jgi:hypothetical protein
MRGAQRNWLFAGLALSTFATLVLEILDTRLLSVLTWYHLSFLAVSLAMLGMAAGAVRVFVGDDRFSPSQAAATLPRYCSWFALSIPATHLANLCIPIPLLQEFSVMEIIAVAVATTVLAIPFVLSGVVVTLALTRTSEPVGRLYASDLMGAALGCLAVIALLSLSDITSVAFAAGAAAALGAWCFHRYSGRPGAGWSHTGLAAVCVLIAVTNASRPDVFAVIYPKNRTQWLSQQHVDVSAWNTHSYITIHKPQQSPAFLWGPGEGAEKFQSTIAWIVIDGEAGTPITKWDGSRESIDWVQYDVTTLPHHLRHGKAAVIGVGGGRDLLSALWGGSSVTGVEVNGILVDALQNRYREFANLTTRPDVRLVHDEARSYLSRQPGQFDVLQMSLIDTWAATGAGAFSLSENGLYTREAWQVFLNALTPNGVFSVSRWFSPGEISEATRVLSMATSAVLERGARNPADHIIMVSRERIATLLISNAGFTGRDREVVDAVTRRFGFSIVTAPWQPPTDPRMQRILASTDERSLASATADDVFDFSPTTDARPFFFSMLKPSAFFRVYDLPRGGVMWGNLRATVTLVVLFAVASVLVITIVGWPLVKAGRPDMPAASLRWASWYFIAIGCGFMFIQIPFLQRFSVFLGHPTYSLAIILFTMILATGVGSFLSDRTSLDDRLIRRIPVLIALVIAASVLLLQPVVAATVKYGLVTRSVVVILFVAPVALLLGYCFPIGMRFVGRASDRTAAWMWGINGAASVLAAIAAVAISMWVGTQANLIVAALLYLSLPLAMRGLSRS